MMTAKGTTVTFINEFIEKKFGRESLKKWQDSLTEQAKSVYSGLVLPANFYPLKEIYLEPTLKICELFYGGDIKAGAFELGRYSADYALKGVYRFFIKLGSPAFLIKKAGTIMSTYYQPSKMEVVDIQEKSAVVRIMQFEEIHEVVEQRVAGWMQRALEISGTKNVKVNITKSLLNKDEYTEFSVTWE